MIVKPIVDCELIEVVGIIECKPRIERKKKILNKLFSLIKQNITAPLRYYSDEMGIPYYYMKKSDQDLADWIKEINPDLIVVYSMSQLLKADIFNIPKYGTINLHPSLLPRYRGPNPDFWMYYNVDLEKGVTVHYIDEGEDTGDILLQESFKMELGMKSPDVNDIAISKIGVNLLIKAVTEIEYLKRKAQPALSPTPRARNLKVEEHETIIDWNVWHIERVWHILRGTELWLNAIKQPGGIYIGNRWIIGEYKKLEHFLTSGRIYKNKYGYKYCVACKDGIIELVCKVNLKSTLIFVLKKMNLVG